ncbi:MAG: AraC family transcriptional regulator [Kofleriaceae bacterium]
MDVLADVLTVTQLGNTVLGCSKMVSPWAMELSPDVYTSVHVMLRGSTWLRIEDQAPIPVAPGDVLLVRSGVRHALLDQPGRRPRPVAAVLAEMPARVARLSPEQANIATEILCAKYRFTHRGAHPLVSRLPALVHLTASNVAGDVQVQLLLQLLHLEATRRGSGSDLVVPRLVDTLLVFIIRNWLSLQPIGEGTASWFSALRDPGIRDALALIHDHPGKPWTVASLATGAGKSRAAFARRFTELVGETPLAYVTRWRMCVAAKALRDSERSISDVARLVGYDSVAAFCTAFKRSHDATPGQFRRAC